MEDKTNLITIKEASTQLGVTHRTLKYYEELGLVTPDRSNGHYRLYSQLDLRRFRRIIRLRSLGFSLSTIQEIIRCHDSGSEPGADGYSQDVLKRIADSIVQQLDTVAQRINSARRELKEAEKIKAELLNDLEYLKRRIAGESSAVLTEERLKARGKMTKSD